MLTLREIIKDIDSKQIAIGHFNIAELATLKAIVEAAKEIKMPVLIGTSEGERDFIGVKQAALLIRSIREELDLPIFLNADHTHSFEKIKEAVDAGYDAVLFDGGKLSWEDNVRETKKVVDYVRSVRPDVLVEGELGYIGSSSEVIKEIPPGAAIRPEDLTTPEQAAEFVKLTGIDLLAPAVGNIHGIIAAPDIKEKIDTARIKQIYETAKTPIVLHGGSGNTKEDFVEAIQNGVRIVHISTELRVLWRNAVSKSLEDHPNEVAPYKVFPEAIQDIRKTVSAYMKLFGRIS